MAEGEGIVQEGGEQVFRDIATQPELDAATAALAAAAATHAAGTTHGGLDLATHKARHASGGPDALSPADIGGATGTHNHDAAYDAIGAADAAIRGITPKSAVKAATTGALPTYTAALTTLTKSTPGAFPAIDGTTINVGDRILVKDEAGSLAVNNGIYILTVAGSGAVPWILTRSLDAFTGAELAGAETLVEDGTVNAAIKFAVSNDTVVLGTTNIIIVKTQAAAVPHKASHAAGGTDALVAADLPSHASRHVTGGADAVAVAHADTGVTANQHHNRDHASAHAKNGADDLASQNVKVTSLEVGGLTGAVAGARLVGGTASGPPSSGTFGVGDFVVDQTGRFFMCTVAGSPGTWVDISATQLAIAEITANFTKPTAGAGAEDITGLSISPVVRSRPIMLHFWCHDITQDTNLGTASVLITDTSNVEVGAKGSVPIANPTSAAGSLVEFNVFRYLTPSPGSVTYKARINTSTAGSKPTLNATTTRRAFLRAYEV